MQRDFWQIKIIFQELILLSSVRISVLSLVTGRMGNNLLVHFPGDAYMIGTFKQIHLDVCKGFYYMGTPAE